MSLLSYQNQERSSKSLQFPNDDDYFKQRIRLWYVSTLIEVFNELTEHINLNSDIDYIKQYEINLRSAIMLYITTKFKEVKKQNSKTANFPVLTRNLE